MQGVTRVMYFSANDSTGQTNRMTRRGVLNPLPGAGAVEIYVTPMQRLLFQFLWPGWQAEAPGRRTRARFECGLP